MSIWTDIQKFFSNRPFGRRKRSPLQGTQRPISVSAALRRNRVLEVEEYAVRPIQSSLDVAYDLLEMRAWCYETRHSLAYLARDCFIERFGRAGSWSIAASMSGKPVHPRVEEIARELSERRSGKNLVLGGDRLFKMVIDGLSLGDSFLEFEIAKDGISNHYCLTKSLYLPPLTMFIEEEDDGRLLTYWQKTNLYGTDGDRRIEPVKTLHFSHESTGIYGMPITLQCVEPWRQLKKATTDLEEAARNTGVIPWLHIMPEGKNEDYKQTYRQEYQSMQYEGVITDLFLMPGADVRKASNTASNLQPMISYWQQCRFQMVVPGVPLWFFPGLGQEMKTGKELANQPALVYSRLISSIRSRLGEQVKWAICLEVLLREGYEFMMEHSDFDIVWPEWSVLPVTEEQLPSAQRNSNGTQDGEPQVPVVDENNRIYLEGLDSAIARGTRQHHSQMGSFDDASNFKHILETT